jgi:UDP-glucose 4-epimerase
VVRNLHDAGTELRALARHPAPWLPIAPAVGELTDDALDAALDGIDAVVHLAGANEVAAAADPEGTTAATVAAARAVVSAARRAGTTRLVYVSTVHVYGAAITDGADLTEETEAAPIAAYAAARLACEAVCADSDVDTVVLRLTNGVGAPPDPAVDRWSLVANDLCRQAVMTERVELRTHGLQWRDFVPLADAVDAIRRAVDPAQLPRGTYNLASGHPRTVRDLAGLVQDAAEQQLGARPPLHAPAAPGHAPAPYTVSIERLAAQGWKPEASLRDAIDETIAFCLAHREVL